MHIPTAQSLLCLSLLALPYASAVPLNENLQPRAATTCNANDIKTVNSSNKQPVAYCKSWLATKQSKSTVKGLTVAQISNACKCVEASASSSSVAAAKKTTSTTKKSSSTIKVTSSATKKTTSSTKKATTSIKTTLKEASISTRPSSATKSSTSTKKTSTSSKQSIASKQSTSSKISASQKSTATSPSVASKKSTWTSVSTKQSSSSSSKAASSKPTSTMKTSSSASISSTSVQSHLSTPASSATSSVFSTTFSAVAIPMDAVTGVVTNQKAPTGVSTRSSSSIQTSSSTVASSATTAASANTKDLSNGSNVITNGIFSQGSTTGWHGAQAFGTKFAVASLAGDGNYEALVKYALAADDNASGQLYQNVTIPANSAWQLSANVYLDYPNGLPVGVSCVVKYSLGSDSIILKQYGVASTSGAVLSDTASGTLSQAFTGRFQIDTYCNSASSSAASFALGFGNIQLLVADAGSAISAAATTNAVATSTSTASSTTSSAASASTSGANMLTNGDFGTGDYSGWALYRLGNPTFAIQGNPNAYVSVITFPAGGDSNSQAALLQQSANATSGTTYTASVGLLLNYPSGLANDGSSCSVQVYFVDSNGFGVSFAQTTYSYGDAAYQSITGSGSVNNGFQGVFDIMIRCYGGAQAIVAGVEDVQLFVS
ncbi:hypothetical protein KCU71_g8202, partial [Aureobasidium melanogenum]